MEVRHLLKQTLLYCSTLVLLSVLLACDSTWLVHLKQ